LSGGPVRLAVLGDPLRFTLSPDLHRAGLEALGIEAHSEAIRTPPASLGETLRGLASRGYRGVNLTMPLKESALEHLARVGDAARRARSVNTVGREAEGFWCETTDGAGFLDLLGTFGRTPARERAVLLGAGGAARSVALALLDAGCASLAVSARDPSRAAEGWRDLPGVELVPWRSSLERDRLGTATLVVNATPLDDDPAGTLPVAELAAQALAIDLRYGPEPTAWVVRVRASGREAWDGLGLLVFQARRSLALWTGREPAVEALARAVGWPR
jgi:shikimate dehydrogenase